MCSFLYDNPLNLKFGAMDGYAVYTQVICWSFTDKSPDTSNCLAFILTDIISTVCGLIISILRL